MGLNFPYCGYCRIYSRTGMRKDKEQEELIEELYRQIGQLKVELDWFSRYVLSWELSITLEMEFCLVK